MNAPGSAGTLRRGPLHDRHEAAGARLIGFAGWEMPVQYAGIRAEHLAVREHAGVFDVSHMGQIRTRGPEATGLLQRLLSADVRRLPVGGAQYAVLCREDGGVLDDLITYRLAECEYLTVTNAANQAADLAWFVAHATGFDADVVDLTDAFAMLAVQGPEARGLVHDLCDGPLPPRMSCCERLLAQTPVTICGTGYTGEDGVELLLDPGDAPAVWDALLSAGAVPAGLGARDTLRLEACLPLYGNELSVDRDPIEAGLGWCCAERTGFIGADAVAAARKRYDAPPDPALRDPAHRDLAHPDPARPAQRLAPFVLDGPGIARQGNAVREGGVVTSGTLSPSLERGIGMAYVDAGLASPGTALTIDVRGTERAATVYAKPIHRRGAGGDA
jgi:aminomethyltransferase